MRCSVCSEVVTPIVACDIDGTLGDYHTHFLRFVSEYNGTNNAWWQGHPEGVPGPPRVYDGSVGFKDWVCWAANISQAMYADIKLAYRQGAQKRSMPPLPHAYPFTEAIRNLGADLWLTTTRPYLRLDGIDPDTREWARRHQIHYEGLLYDREKYRLLASRIDPARVVAVIDDLGYLYDQAEEVFGVDVPLLVRTKWNRAVERMTTVTGLDMAFGIVEQRVIKWKEQHG